MIILYRLLKIMNLTKRDSSILLQEATIDFMREPYGFLWMLIIMLLLHLR
nr:MAG TPA: hypothetical protein [Caudoviricetes sp.]